MARPIDQICLDCNALRQPEAIALHRHVEKSGEHGNKKRCRVKRSHYWNSKDNNAKQRGQYRTKKHMNQTLETKASILFPVQTSPIELFYLYQTDRKDAHLHAIELSI